MPIKFGDLIENANSSYAVIDLTDNQSRGVAFIDELGALTDGISSNLTAITPDKRRQGMLLVDKGTAEVYILEGADSDNDNTYTDAEFGTAPGETGTKWKAVGSLELQTTDIPVNIDDTYANNGTGTSPNVGKTFGKYHPGFEQVVGSQGNQVGKVPVAAWMTEKAANPSYGVIASAQGATALEIIRDALNELFPLQPTITVSGEIEFNQPDGTITISSVSVPNVNDDEIVKFQVYRREIGTGSWTLHQEITGASIQNATSATATANPTDFSWDVGANQFYDFDGFEFYVYAEDSLGATGNSGVVQVQRQNYYAPTVSNFAVERQYDNAFYNGGTGQNETDFLRTAFNVHSTIAFDVLPNSNNDSSLTDGSHTVKVLRKNTTAGAGGGWGQIKTFTFTGNTTQSFSFNDDGTGGDDTSTGPAITATKIQYRVIVTDGYTSAFPNADMIEEDGSTSDTWASDYYAGSTDYSNAAYSHVSEQIRFALPVFGGFIDADDFGGQGPILDPATIDQAMLDTMVDFATGGAEGGTTDPSQVQEAYGSFPYLLWKPNIFPPLGDTYTTSGNILADFSTLAPPSTRFFMLIPQANQTPNTGVPSGTYYSTGNDSEFNGETLQWGTQNENPPILDALFVDQSQVSALEGAFYKEEDVEVPVVGKGDANGTAPFNNFSWKSDIKYTAYIAKTTSNVNSQIRVSQ